MQKPNHFFNIKSIWETRDSHLFSRSIKALSKLLYPFAKTCNKFNPACGGTHRVNLLLVEFFIEANYNYLQSAIFKNLIFKVRPSMIHSGNLEILVLMRNYNLD